MKKIEFNINIGDVCMLIAILFRVALCIKDGYISTHNAFWLIILIYSEIFFFVNNITKEKEGNKNDR